MGDTMSKITFRADDDLVRQLEEFDASKSEVMREALREYLDDADEEERAGGRSVDDALEERVDELLAERIDAYLGAHDPGRRRRHEPPSDTGRDINVNVSLESVAPESADAHVGAKAPDDSRKTGDDDPQTAPKTCGQCGEEIGDDHVYCPNCGEKASHRVFCDCGDELRSDWAFCPSCGRRTPAADVLDRS
jgi:predicted transcriptional regulator